MQHLWSIIHHLVGKVKRSVGRLWCKFWAKKKHLDFSKCSIQYVPCLLPNMDRIHLGLGC